MSFRLFRFGGEWVTSLGSIEEEDLSISQGLEFSIGSVEVISISDDTGFISSTFRARFSFGGIGDISQESPGGGTDKDGFFKNKPDNIFFTWGEREGSSIFIVIERRGTVVLIIVIDEFHDVEIFREKIVSFFKEGIGQVKDIHFFESLDNGTGSLSIYTGNNSFLFERSFNSFVDNLQFSIKFLSIDGMFTRSVQQNFTNLIFSSIKIGHFTHINFGVFGDKSKNIQVIKNQDIGFFN